VSSEQDAKRAAKRKNMVRVILVVAVTLVLLMGVFAAYEISAMEEQISLMETQNALLQSEIQALNARVNLLADEIKLLTGTFLGANYQVSASGACVAASASCPGNVVYEVTLANNGSGTIPSGYPIYLEFVDLNGGGHFQLNTTMPLNLQPGASTLLEAAQWPTGTNATSILFPNDSVQLVIQTGSHSTRVFTIVVS
jgi:cell division protein FtsB